jgi:hypothetical protein
MPPAGHYSPIVKQLRGKAKPDGMVLVVGGCATGAGLHARVCRQFMHAASQWAAQGLRITQLHQPTE